MLPLSSFRLHTFHWVFFSVALCTYPNRPCSAEKGSDDRQISKSVEMNGLSLTIRLDKREYRVGEQIDLYFTLKNESNATLFIGEGALAPEYHEAGPGRHFEVHVQANDSNELFFWSGMATEGLTSALRKVFKLSPMESFEGYIHIYPRVEQNVQPNANGGAFEDKVTHKVHVLGKHGRRYRVKLRYQVDNHTHTVWKPPSDFSMNHLWKGSLDSEVLNFNIVNE